MYTLYIYIYIHTYIHVTSLPMNSSDFSMTKLRPPEQKPSQGALPAPRSKAWQAGWAKSRMSWEHGQTIGKPWENHRKMVVEWDFIGYLVGG